ncbi:MAG: ATP-binding cassette domain-containing protein [Alphaproteobacteria bacterium]|nr:ATP-binding cassette domain-containing protein [Alphaproteobacteria bacterium]
MVDDLVIDVRHLTTRFGSKTIHDDLTFQVRRGEVMGLVGGSGTGKSVLLKSIVGLMRPHAADITILGEHVSADPSGYDRLRGRWGMLFQDGALFSSLTVGQNVQVPMLERGGMSQALINELIALKIDMVGLPADACPKYPSELSGGMRKRAGLARSLALDPEILFLDEPTAGLDPIGAAAFDHLIRDLSDSLGLTVVMITHDLDSLAAICDRISVLIDKKVVVGTMAELTAHPHPWIQSYFHGERARAAFAETVG